MTEHAVAFPVASESLVGVFTAAEPSDDHGRPAIIFLNAGLLHRIGPNRLYVRMAREMAGRGFSSLRFDLSGIGDSLPRTDGLPLRAAALRDVQDALDFLSRKRTLSSFILSRSLFGGRSRVPGGARRQTSRRRSSHRRTSVPNTPFIRI